MDHNQMMTMVALKRVVRCIPLCLVLCSCSPRIVEHLVVQRDTTYISQLKRDSVYFRDSIYIREQVKGDTIYIKEYRDRWRDRIREVHDTIINLQVDSVAVERVKEVKVEKPLPLGKKVRLWAFLPLLVLAIVGWRKEILKVIRKIAGL